MAPPPPKAGGGVGGSGDSNPNDGAAAAAAAAAAAVADDASAAATTTTTADNNNDNRPSSSSGWSRARAAAGAAAAAASFRTLRDMVGDDAYVEPAHLRRVRRLGEGGFATVDLCDLLTAPLPPSPSSQQQIQQKQQQQQQQQYLRVAVKRLRPHLVETPREFETFASEVALLRRLRHPNIAGFVGAGSLEDASSAYVVQEYASGDTLRSLISWHVLTQRAAGRRRRGRAGLRGAGLYRQGDAVDVCLGVARALAYLHSREPMVIHRDVKPDNVLLCGPWPSAPSAPSAAAAAAAAAGSANGPDGPAGPPSSSSCAQSPLRFEAKLTDFGLSATVDARKARALKQLVRRASERALSPPPAGGAGDHKNSNGLAPVPSAPDEWAVEGGAGLGRRGLSPPAPAPAPAPAALSIVGSPAGSVVSLATSTPAQLDAVFDRRLSSRALLSPALLREWEQQRQQEEEDEDGGSGSKQQQRPASSSAASVAGSEHQVYDLTSMTGSLLYMAPEVYLRAAAAAAQEGAGDGDDGDGATKSAGAGAGAGAAGSGGPCSSSSSAYNEKADVFSFAVLLREALSAYLLSFAFVGQDEVDAYVARVANGYRPPIDPRWPEPLRLLIADCWQQDPRRRPSMAEVVRRLERVAADEGGLPRVGVDGGGWDAERGEAGGAEAGAAHGDGGGGAGARCCAVM